MKFLCSIITTVSFFSILPLNLINLDVYRKVIYYINLLGNVFIENKKYREGDGILKKILLIISSVIFLVGCSNGEGANEKNQSFVNLEDQIQKVMNEHNYPSDTILNYEIKNNFIYVFTKTNSSLNVVVLEYSTDLIKLVMEYTSINQMSILDPEYEDMPVLTVVKTGDTNIAGVKILGEPAKAFQSFEEVSDDYRIETKYWIHFTEMKEEYSDFENSNLPVNSVELIKQ